MIIFNIGIDKESALEQSGSSGRSLSQFLWHEATGIISTPPPSPGWDASPSQGYPQH